MSAVASPAVTPPYIRDFRKQINAAIARYDLMPGLQAICKGRYKGFPNYQVKIIRECFKKDPHPSVILGGREIGKTFPLGFGFFLRLITQPNFELFCVPGEKIDQAKVALRYMDILSRKSSVIKKQSGINKKLRLEWSTLTKQFANGSIVKALAPNEGVLSEHGSVWCDEYQSLPEEVDKALDGFDNRPGDRRWLSGTAQIRGSPLHRAFQVNIKRFPKNVLSFPVKLAIDAGILSQASVESKRMVNGGKLNDIEFDAWFNGVFPDLGTLGWHPIESSYNEDWVKNNLRQFVMFGTGCDPGIPQSHFIKMALLTNNQVHAIREFDIDDLHVDSIASYTPGILCVEHGHAWGGGYNAPYHSILQEHGVFHFDSYCDEDDGKRLFSDAFALQSKNNLYVNPLKCPSLWRACEEQTFDTDGKMDRLPLTHYIFAMLHGIHACKQISTNAFTSVSRAARAY